MVLRPRWCTGAMRTRILAVCLLPVLLTAACTNGSESTDGKGVATVDGSARPSVTPSLSLLEQGRLFARCMRDHAVPMEDPQVDPNGDVHMPGADKKSLPDDTLVKAHEACDRLTPVLDADTLAQKKKSARDYSKCMRANGVEAFPDPEPDGRIRLPEEQTDPDYDRAKGICDALDRSAHPQRS